MSLMSLSAQRVRRQFDRGCKLLCKCSRDSRDRIGHLLPLRELRSLMRGEALALRGLVCRQLILDRIEVALHARERGFEAGYLRLHRIDTQPDAILRVRDGCMHTCDALVRVGWTRNGTGVVSPFVSVSSIVSATVLIVDLTS